MGVARRYADEFAAQCVRASWAGMGLSRSHLRRLRNRPQKPSRHRHEDRVQDCPQGYTQGYRRTCTQGSTSAHHRAPNGSGKHCLHANKLHSGPDLATSPLAGPCDCCPCLTSCAALKTHHTPGQACSAGQRQRSSPSGRGPLRGARCRRAGYKGRSARLRTA